MNGVFFVRHLHSLTKTAGQLAWKKQATNDKESVMGQTPEEEAAEKAKAKRAENFMRWTFAVGIAMWIITGVLVYLLVIKIVS